jgi:hypothetical protein
MSEIELVSINPVEWDMKRYRCYRYLKIKINETLTMERLVDKMKECKIRNVEVKEEQDHWIRWQRKNRPPVLIDLSEHCVKSELIALDDFDREDIEHQASIVLRLLKKFGFASFLRKRVSFLPSLIGWNDIERRQYHYLIERGTRRRLEIYGYAPIANKKMSRKRVDENKNQAALKRREVAEVLPLDGTIEISKK